jgi:hypothetical protein
VNGVFLTIPHWTDSPAFSETFTPSGQPPSSAVHLFTGQYGANGATGALHLQRDTTNQRRFTPVSPFIHSQK